ncbi:SpdA protein [Streptomyces olivaceus]|nr:SpdA protein [Streptomyces olivaceus]
MFRSIRIDAVLIQAVIAGALSFAHLHDLAEAAGQTGWKAWAYPVSVDLLLVAVWRRLRTERSGLAWFWFLVALVASLGANIATAGLLDLDHVPAWLRIVVAGWPALAFLGGTLLAHTPDAPPAPTPEPAPRTVPVVDRPATPDPTPAPEVSEVSEVSAPESAPALPEAPAPAPVPAQVSVPVVPPALVDHARKVAIEHRTRTGTDIDTATLRARLGIPEDLAGAIVAQLA